MTTEDIIILARKHLGTGEMDSSARLNFSDAITWQNEGAMGAARISALRSLKYSIGILHADYKKATE